MFRFDGLRTGHVGTVNSVIFIFDFSFMISIENDSFSFWDTVRGVELGLFPKEDLESVLSGQIPAFPFRMECSAIH